METRFQGKSTHSILKALFLAKHLPERLQDFDAQLLLFIHELLGVFNQSDMVTREMFSHLKWCTADAVTGAEIKNKAHFVDHHPQRQQQGHSTPRGWMRY